MNAPMRLGIYGAGLVALFGGAFATAAAVIPESAADRWVARADSHDMDTTEPPAPGAAAAVRGQSLEADGFVLGPLSAPSSTGSAGAMAFTITGSDGSAVTAFDESHTKRLHLIVVRSDGSQFRHVHPQMDAAGVWSIPWQWATAGSYRVFADIVPSATGENVTLSRTVDVAGEPAPVRPSAISTVARVAGFEVSLTGTLSATDHSRLTATITRDGRPVRTLEPYLGAFGHLVALREGDLAYLHVHPEGDEPRAGEPSGPEVAFTTTAPTRGRYFLYLDFQVDGAVHTAEFVVDAGAGGSGGDPESGHGSGHGS